MDTDHPTPASEATADAAPSGDVTMAQVAHLGALAGLVGIPSFVAPLVVYLVRKEDPLAAPHAKEALNFHITWLAVGLITVVLAVVTLGLGLIVAVPVAIAGFVAWIIGLIRGVQAAGAGNPDVRYPMTLRMIS